MGMYSPTPTPEPRSPRWTNLAYENFTRLKGQKVKGGIKTKNKPVKVTGTGTGRTWKSSDEGFLIREYKEFNESSTKDYAKFLDTTAYTLKRSKLHIRNKLKELNSRGIISKRKH